MSEKPSQRTRLDFWRRQQGLTTEALGRLLGTAQMTAWRYCQPLSGKHQHPQCPLVRQRIETVTKGACNAANYTDLVDAETGEALADPSTHEVKA
jgi:hypothetical protein